MITKQGSRRGSHYDEMVAQLSSLGRYHRQLVRAYMEAMSWIGAEGVRQRFRSYRADHERQVTGIRNALGDLRLARRPVERPPGYNGDEEPFHSPEESEKAVHSILENIIRMENALVSGYRSLIRNWKSDGHWSERLDEEVKECIEDEKRHEEYVRRVLDEGLWKESPYKKAG